MTHRLCKCFLFLTMPAGIAGACESTYDQMVESARRDRAIEEAYLDALFHQSDLVFVGVVSDVGDSGDPEYAQIASVRVEHTLRGIAQSATEFLMYKRHEPLPDASEDEVQPLEAIPSCDEPYDPEQEQPYVQEGTRALFYVQEGVLRRVNSFPIEPPLLLIDPTKEIEFLENLPPRHREDGG